MREAPDNIYTDSGIFYSDEFAPYTKMMEVYGLTLIALPEAPDDFMLQVAATLKEMFVQTPETDRELQEAVLKQMYRYRALLPVVSEPQSHQLDDVGGAEDVASVVDIIMYDVPGQANEVIEHLLHAITNTGLHYALNPEFGLYEQSQALTFDGVWQNDERHRLARNVKAVQCSDRPSLYFLGHMIFESLAGAGVDV